MALQSVSPIGLNRAAPSMQMTRDTATARRVLCVTDLTSRSQRAVARAARLARELDAELIVLHVIEPAELARHPLGAREEMAQQLAAIAIPLPRDVQIRVRTGNYVQEIGAVAKEIDADMIVLGAQRRKPLAPLIVTTAERIIALARRPTLIVNLDAQVRYAGVVIAAELSDARSGAASARWRARSTQEGK